jgi:predicted O-linked N-acetylglucosamine transferase (SPINDLY family)
MSHRDSSPDSASQTLDDMCGNAIELQVTGQSELAEQLYRRILQAEPKHAAANHCIGMLNVQMRRPADGLPHLLAALESNPQIPDYWLGYLEALLLAGRTEDAKETLALGMQHGLAGASALDFAKRLEARLSQPTAEERPAAPAEPPASPQPRRADRRRESRLAQKQEDSLLTLVKQGKFAEGLALARTLTERFPERGPAWKTLGALLWVEGHKDDALAAMQMSARLMPQDAEAHCNLGATLIKVERFDDAETHLRAALKIDPGSAAAYIHLGDAYQLQGRNAEAEASVRRAIALRTDDAADDRLIYSSLLYLLSHDPATDADALFAEHCRIGEIFEAPLRASWPPHPNDPDPNRSLKVGLVSGDLCNHAVAHFIEPVLAELRDYPSLELHAYYTNVVEDTVSRRLRGYFKGWHRVAALSDIQMTQKIMDDHIDILIDLSGHTSLNRLRAFARKPAPIQASWIGYPGTTGLRAMDYYLADRHFLPPGQFDRHFVEKLVYFHALAPFRPHESAPPVNGLPALETGSIRFGSFNRLGKINEPTIGLWSQLLHALPAAKLTLAGISPVERHDRLLDRFAAHGITSDRLAIYPRCAMDEYLALHHHVDICLDTMPYTGGTSTSHALWMGVPTLTVAGSTPAARQGASIQELLGLHGFSAGDRADFVAKGVYWSEHLAALAELRSGLRARWQQAPGRQPAVIADGLERAMRHMWRRWCAGLPAESFEIAAPVLENSRKRPSTKNP